MPPIDRNDFGCKREVQEIQNIIINKAKKDDATQAHKDAAQKIRNTGGADGILGDGTESAIKGFLVAEGKSIDNLDTSGDGKTNLAELRASGLFDAADCSPDITNGVYTVIRGDCGWKIADLFDLSESERTNFINHIVDNHYKNGILHIGEEITLPDYVKGKEKSTGNTRGSGNTGGGGPVNPPNNTEIKAVNDSYNVNVSDNAGKKLELKVLDNDQGENLKIHKAWGRNDLYKSDKISYDEQSISVQLPSAEEWPENDTKWECAYTLDENAEKKGTVFITLKGKSSTGTNPVGPKPLATDVLGRTETRDNGTIRKYYNLDPAANEHKKRIDTNTDGTTEVYINTDFSNNSYEERHYYNTDGTVEVYLNTDFSNDGYEERILYNDDSTIKATQIWDAHNNNWIDKPAPTSILFDDLPEDVQTQINDFNAHITKVNNGWNPNDMMTAMDKIDAEILSDAEGTTNNYTKSEPDSEGYIYYSSYGSTYAREQVDDEYIYREYNLGSDAFASYEAERVIIRENNSKGYTSLSPYYDLGHSSSSNQYQIGSYNGNDLWYGIDTGKKYDNGEPIYNQVILDLDPSTGKTKVEEYTFFTSRTDFTTYIVNDDGTYTKK